jgi:hypothetical protein
VLIGIVPPGSLWLRHDAESVVTGKCRVIAPNNFKNVKLPVSNAFRLTQREPIEKCAAKA